MKDGDRFLQELKVKMDKINRLQQNAFMASHIANEFKPYIPDWLYWLELDKFGKN
jgi:hypothetical protein